MFAVAVRNSNDPKEDISADTSRNTIALGAI